MNSISYCLRKKYIIACRFDHVGHICVFKIQHFIEQQFKGNLKEKRNSLNIGIRKKYVGKCL